MDAVDKFALRMAARTRSRGKRHHSLADLVLAGVRAEGHLPDRPSVASAKQLRPQRWAVADAPVADAEGQ